jgi:hypothetical protein
LPLELSPTRTEAAEGYLALSGPSTATDASRLPLRGDLAHIKLAGRYFVPHYAVPMPHLITDPMWLRSAARLSSEEVCELAVGRQFDVLDMAGDWAWGQYGEDGPVGYVLLSNLQAL